MVSTRLIDMLNAQLGREFASSNIYLQMSGWCAAQGLDGFALFLKAHSQEEMGHMFRLFQFILDSDGQPIVPELPRARHEYTDVKEVFEDILAHERQITKAINELSGAAFEERDFATFNFLQWYVAEQHEEEALFKSLLDKIRLVGTEGQGLYLLDAEIGRMRSIPAGSPAAATDAVAASGGEAEAGA